MIFKFLAIAYILTWFFIGVLCYDMEMAIKLSGLFAAPAFLGYFAGKDENTVVQKNIVAGGDVYPGSRAI